MPLQGLAGRSDGLGWAIWAAEDGVKEVKVQILKPLLPGSGVATGPFCLHQLSEPFCLHPGATADFLAGHVSLFGILRTIRPRRLPDVFFNNQSRISWAVPASCKHSYLLWHCLQNVRE